MPSLSILLIIHWSFLVRPMTSSLMLQATGLTALDARENDFDLMGVPWPVMAFKFRGSCFKGKV